MINKRVPSILFVVLFFAGMEVSVAHAGGDPGGSDALRKAAMELSDACKFEAAREKLKQDISLNRDGNQSRLPESYLLLGNVYRLEGLYTEARKWTSRGVSSIEKLKPADEKRLSAAYNYLALLDNSTGHFSLSEKNARKALSYSIKSGLGEQNQAMHRVVLANALRQQGKYKEALAELEMALPVLKTGEEKRLTAAAMNNMGALYFWMGDYQRASHVLKEGLKQRLEISGGDHPDVANSYLDLGCVEFKLGERKAALEHLEEAHRIRASKLGVNHPETFSSAANLAVVLLAKGDTRRSLELLKETVERGKTVLGRRNPDLAQYEDDYANALAGGKEFALARLVQTDANAIRKATFGAASREYAGGLRSLAQIERQAGNKEKCLKQLSRSVAIYIRAGQTPDPDLAETLDELASVHASMNELEKARQTFDLAVKEREKAGNSVSYAVSLANLAEILRRMKRDSEGFSLLKKAAAVIETLPTAQRDNPDSKAILERCKAVEEKAKRAR